MNKKTDWLEIAKIFCLITPTIISIGILISLLLIIFGRQSDDINLRLKSIEYINGSLISIVGVAVTAWVGLNIYNIVERKDIEKLKIEQEDLKNNIKILNGNIKNSLFEEDTKKQIIDLVFESEEMDEINKKENFIFLFIFITLLRNNKLNNNFLSDFIDNIEDLFEEWNYNLNFDKKNNIIDALFSYVYLKYYTHISHENTDSDFIDQFKKISEYYFKNNFFKDEQLKEMIKEKIKPKNS